MMAADEDALICDFAEYYHIYDYQALDAKYAAILAGGLRDDSRSIEAICGMSDSKTMLLAGILDAVRILAWQNTSDGHNGRNKPESVISIFSKKVTKKEGAVQAFDTPDDFHAMRRRLIDGNTDCIGICSDNSIS